MPEPNIEDLTRPATRHYGGKRLPLVAVLRGFGSQENSYEEGTVMCAAAELLTILHGLAENNAMNEILTLLNMATHA